MSCVLAVALVFGVITFARGVLGAAINVEMVAQGLRAYQATHGDYPPDLGTLAAAGVLPSSPLDSPDSDVTAGVRYVAGVSPGDPGDWILAYARGTIMGQPLYFVVFADGTTDAYDEAEFTAALQAFQEEYEARRGQPPLIIEAGGAAPDTQPVDDGG